MRLAVLCAALAAGCASSGGFEKTMNGWIGASEGALVGGMGPPQNVYVAPDGERILTFSKSRNVQIGGHTQYQPVTSTTTGNVGNTQFRGTTTSYQATQSPVHNIAQSCTVNFTVRNGSVTQWQANGNNCRN